MSLMKEYIDKKWENKQFEDELISLIKKYNKLRGTYLFLYMADFEKPIMEKNLIQDDYYIIYDLLNNSESEKLDFFIETPGGSGEVAEEIVRFIRSKFKTVSFIVTGQAKSAGTIIVLSGDEIYMTKTGSLGPIDAQMRIGRSMNSTYDYKEWIEDTRKKAENSGRLNPFDATIVAQITPGEINGVLRTHTYAQDLVKDWLVKYKFKDWNTTETSKKVVTNDMKIKRASEIAEELTNRSRWQTHARSIKLDDLISLGLRVNDMDKDSTLSEIVYRIHTVCRFLFNKTNSFKIFATADSKIFRQAQTMMPPIPIQKLIPQIQKADAIEIGVKCNNCGQEYKFYSKVKDSPKIDEDMKKKGLKPFPFGNQIACSSCGMKIDISQIRKQIEQQIKKKLIS